MKKFCSQEGWSRKKAQWLKALAALAEDPDSTPRTHMAAHNALNSSSKRSEALFYPPRVPGTHIMFRQNSFIQINYFLRKHFNY